MPSRWNIPRVLLSLANSLSPWRTWTSTEVWLSAAVEKIWLFLVGMVVFLSMITVFTPPMVSIPSERGVTSRRSKPLTSPPSTPPWRAAPIATHSSGLIPLNGSLPLNFWIASWTAGILVEPPTSKILSISFIERPESFIAWRTGPIVASTRSAVISLNLALVRVVSRCLGPVASAVINGREIWAVVIPERSIFAFSAASLTLCIAILSFERSIPVSLLNWATI